MTQISPHFSLSEFTQSQTASRLKINNTPTSAALENLKRTAMCMEEVRSLLGKPITISSGYRSPKLNKAVGGSTNSKHVTGQAVDFICPAFGSPEEVMRAIIKAGISFDQCILEFPPNGWVHMSFTENPRKQALIIDTKGTRAFK